jgi:HlyD family secretion protein
MGIDTKHKDLEGLRIDRAALAVEDPGGSKWARTFILVAVAVIVFLGLTVLAYRYLFTAAPEVETVRAAAEGGDVAGSVILTATGYIVPHHKINVNSKVTGRVKWIGVEKGDKVKEGQVLVRLEDDEFRAQYRQAKGAADSARAYLEELEHGSRPEEIAQAQHNLDEARATLANDKLTLDRNRDLFRQGVVSQQALDDATAKFEADQQRADSLNKAFELAKIGPRPEEILRAKGALEQAEGQAAYAKSLLDATVIRAPVSGTILERTAEKGELITAQFASSAEGGPQGSVVALADLNDIQADLDIAQDDFAKLGPHQKAIVTVDAFPDLKWNGVIAEISPEANRQKATVEVKVQILNPDSHLRPEMNTTVRFLADENKKPTTQQMAGAYVPSGAMREIGGKEFVFIAFDGKAMKRHVTVISQRSAGALVSGLNGGENVILNPPDNLKDGDKIKVKGQS